MQKLCHNFPKLSRIPTYAIAPCIGPQIIVESKFGLHGSELHIIGFFCLNPVRFSPPAYIEK